MAQGLSGMSTGSSQDEMGMIGVSSCKGDRATGCGLSNPGVDQLVAGRIYLRKELGLTEPVVERHTHARQGFFLPRNRPIAECSPKCDGSRVCLMELRGQLRGQAVMALVLPRPAGTDEVVALFAPVLGTGVICVLCVASHCLTHARPKIAYLTLSHHRHPACAQDGGGPIADGGISQMTGVHRRRRIQVAEANGEPPTGAEVSGFEGVGNAQLKHLSQIVDAVVR
jgi:hypothetical protein